MNLLKNILSERGISQIELAKHIGVADSAVSKWIKWGFKIPVKHVEKICLFLKCKPSDLNNEDASA